MKSDVTQLPLVLGITGHRNLRSEDVGVLRRLIHEFFADVQEEYPHTPLMLISPLAEGADRIAAEVALESGIDLIVPLPMPVRLYERDFESWESLGEFRGLLKRAKHVFELPLMDGTFERDLEHYGARRDEQYALVGAYVARHCQILIALWDGVPSTLVGSTAQVVEFKIHGIPSSYAHQSPLDIVESGPVYHILTPRSGAENIPNYSLTTTWIYPETDNQNETEFQRIFRRIDGFNADCKQHADVVAAQKPKSKSYVLPPEIMASMPESLAMNLDRYATADVLAGLYQRRTLRTLLWLFVLVFIVVSAQVTSFIFTGNPWVLLTYILGLTAAYTGYLWAHRGEFEIKYLDYRALAEGLRIQLFWQIAGLKDNIAEHYMRKQKGDLDWIRDAVITWSIPLGDYKNGDFQNEDTLGERLQLIGKHWIDDQYQYFLKSAQRDSTRLKKLKIWGNAFFFAGLALATLETSFDFLLSHNPLTHLTLLLGVIQVFGALLHGYGEKRLFSEQSRQYTRMATLFANAKKYFMLQLKTGNKEAAQSLTLELGKEALIENGDWVMLHRERPMEVPKAG